MQAIAIDLPDAATDGNLSELLGYNLKRVYNLLHSEVVPALAEFKLRTVSFSALSIILETPGVNQTQLAAALSVERSNLVQIIDEMVGLGLIERKPVTGDRRRHALMPKPEGIAVFEKARKAICTLEDDFFGALSTEDRDHLQRIMAQLRKARP